MNTIINEATIVLAAVLLGNWPALSAKDCLTDPLYPYEA
jgi:hypothetical protein